MDHHGPFLYSGYHTTSINCCKNILLQRQQNYGVWNDNYQNLLYCICSNIQIDYIMVFGLQQESVRLITPMAWISYYMSILLTHWGRMTHICVSEIIIIGSDNGLSPGRRQAIIWTNARILLIGPLGTNFNEILIEINTFLFRKMHLKMSSAKWRLFCLDLNMLNVWPITTFITNSSVFKRVTA